MIAFLKSGLAFLEVSIASLPLQIVSATKVAPVSLPAFWGESYSGIFLNLKALI
jgi:hypothetical protein